MAITLQQIQQDRDDLSKIKDKTALREDYATHPHAGHSKYNIIANLYELLKTYINAQDQHTNNFHLGFGNLVILTKLTLQIAIMELFLGQQSKEQAERALEFIRTAENLNRNTYVYHVLQLFIDIEIASAASIIRKAVRDNIEISTLWFVVKMGANPRASDEMQRSALLSKEMRQPILHSYAQEFGLPQPELFYALFDAFIARPNTSFAELLNNPQHLQVKNYFDRLRTGSDASDVSSGYVTQNGADTHSNLVAGIEEILPATLGQSERAEPVQSADSLWQEITVSGSELKVKLARSWYAKNKQGAQLLDNFLQNAPFPITHPLIQNKLAAFKMVTEAYSVSELTDWVKNYLGKTSLIANAQEKIAPNNIVQTPADPIKKSIYLWQEIIESGRILSDQLAQSWFAKNKQAATLIKYFINNPPPNWQPKTLYDGLSGVAEMWKHNSVAANWATTWLKRFYTNAETYGIYLTDKIDFPTQLQLLNKAVLQFSKASSGKLDNEQKNNIYFFQSSIELYATDTSIPSGALNRNNYFAILRSFVADLYNNNLALLTVLERHSNLAGAKDSLMILYQWLAYFRLTPQSTLELRTKKQAYEFSRLHTEFGQLSQWLYQQATIKPDSSHATDALQLITYLQKFTTAISHGTPTLPDGTPINHALAALLSNTSDSAIESNKAIMQKLKVTVAKLDFLGFSDADIKHFNNCIEGLAA